MPTDDIEILEGALAACRCRRCITARGDTINGLPRLMAEFIVCPSCGDKRCAHATDHEAPCAKADLYAHNKWVDDALDRLRAAERERDEAPKKLWLWRNFVDGRPEFWAFDNPFPVHLDSADPQTLGEPCGYALLKPSRAGRTDVSEAEVLRRIKASTRLEK